MRGTILELARDAQVHQAKKTPGAAKPVSEIEAERIHDEVVGRWEIEDWKHPDYQECISHRAAVLAKIRADKTGRTLSALKLFYKLNPADFINDWGYTTDPRNPEVGLPTYVPFILFPKQREWVDFILRKWRAREPGLTEKSRDCGLSWLAVALGSTLCLFYTGLVIGYGSRKAEYVDKRGQPKTLFWKAREFMKKLPEEFRGGWRFEKDAPLMRLTFPQTESTMSGEGGDNIGRGDRTSIFFVDEHAYLEHSESVDSALSQTTNCQQDISSVHGMANAFAVKRHSGKVEVFTFDWRAQPLDATIITPSGYKPMGDVRVGDLVIGQDGRSKQVLGVFPQGRKEVYRVSFSDGSSTESCLDHLWDVIPYGNQRAERKHITKTLPLREIIKNYRERDARGYNKHRYQIPLARAVEFSSNGHLPIDPYVLGCLLGDGYLPPKRRPLIMSVGPADAEIIELMAARLPDGCVMRHDRNIQYRIAATKRSGARGLVNPVVRAIEGLGLSGTESHSKFVPKPYLFASQDDRLKILQGLLDTDGSVSQSSPGMAKYSTVSQRLAHDVTFLVQSLGGVAVHRHIAGCASKQFPSGRSHACRDAFGVEVRLPAEMNPFLLGRKANALLSGNRYQARRSIIDISPVGSKECQCIKVEDGRYLTDQFIVTHNSDPRKDLEWYAKQKAELDEVTVAQEIDRDYSASVEGILIPSKWVRSAIDAHVRLKLPVEGKRAGALDLADEGRDKNAFCGAHGVVIEYLEEWSGKGGDLFATAERAFALCDDLGYQGFRWDADGLGASLRGDARVLNEKRRGRPVLVTPFRGSEGVWQPDNYVPGSGTGPGDKGILNKDKFANRKAQAFWALRERFRKTYRWVEQDKPCKPDEIISISSKCQNWQKLVTELSQPTTKDSGAGKLTVNKAPDGAPSPNLADAVMMRFAPMDEPLNITPDVLSRVAQMRRHRRR